MDPLFGLSAFPCLIIVELKKALDGQSVLGEIKRMWINEVAPERLAELFHHYHQALTPEISGKGSEGRGAWKEVPQQEKSRLVAAARLALLELESMTSERARSKEYFAQPGEAEWGC
jgi:hypothetical protein